MEKGSPGEWKGSNPHSYAETFSLSGIFFDSIIEARHMIRDNKKLNIIIKKTEL